MSRRTILAVSAVLCAVAFGAGLLRLFLWRFEVGDVYPRYSSFRTDPLGTRALHDALGALPGRTASRFLRPTSDLPAGRDTCLLLIGSDPALAGDAGELEDLDRFLTEGGRVVLALDLRDLEADRPSRFGRRPADTKTGDRREAGPDSDGGRRPDKAGNAPPPVHAPTVAPPPEKPTPRPPKPPAKGREPAAHPGLRLLPHWGLGVAPAARDSTARRIAAGAVPDAAAGPLPATLPWPTRGALALQTPQWTPIYQVGPEPVVAQRRVGRGALIAVADSYLFSNEGLRDTLQPQFLSWVLGPSSRILMDETHLGIQSRPGVMALARRYRLHGFFAALAGLALLYLWQSLTRPLSGPPARAPEEVLGGRAAPSALRDLLRHHLRREALLEHCVEAWARTAALSPPVLQRRRERLREALRAYAATGPRQRDAAACYRALCEIIARKE